jgi:hypothetical protein
LRAPRLAPLLLALAAAGCEDPKPPPPAAEAVPPGRAEAARQAAEDRLRARLRAEGPLTLRAVQVHRQALPGTLAVCGQVNPSGRADEPFIPYVAVVTAEGEGAPRAELHLGATTQEATRVYIELVDRCFDGGGPPSARAGIRPLPPLPSGLPRTTEPEPPRTPQATAPVPSQPPPPSATPAAGSVTTTARHPVNIRAHPSGGGAVVRVVPRASTLRVYAEAPGGWLQIGEGEPWGWVHSSMLEGR